jgi:epoxyqueuosine reductase
VLPPLQQNAAAAKRLAGEYGFILSGIAAIPEDGQAPRAAELSSWLAQGLHGPLSFLLNTQQARANIHLRFPWARSVLALGAFYGGPTAAPDGKLPAYVAHYAQGRDYHKVLEPRLKKLAEALKTERICTQAKWYADTGPLLERAWAERAGLGWIGKNACLIHPQFGSFFILAEMLLDSTPQPDIPAPARCGACTRCLEACPTQALKAPGIIDARLCITSWNVENRGAASSELWPGQGSWVAGCDACQRACPYNSLEHALTPEAELSAPLPWHNLTLAECIGLSTELFETAFAGSALRRASLKGLRLNAITAAGNLRSSACRPALENCLADPDADIRARAAWAIKKFEEP